MKISILSLVSILALSGLSYAGGDIAPIEEPITEAPLLPWMIEACRTHA
ncbi:MAG: hypothetical protein U9Q90_08700 [Campylobacterota bacterium]|nr:hypothetical protein [Campylobacterota bacterium]